MSEDYEMAENTATRHDLTCSYDDCPGQHAHPTGLPKRRIQFTLTIGADDLRSLSGALYNLALDVEEHGERDGSRMSGGYASGHHWTMRVDSSMDHDRYASELEAWREARQPRS